MKVVPGAAQRRRYGAAWLREAVSFARISGEVIVSFVTRRSPLFIRCGLMPSSGRAATSGERRAADIAL